MEPGARARAPPSGVERRATVRARALPVDIRALPFPPPTPPSVGLLFRAAAAAAAWDSRRTQLATPSTSGTSEDSPSMGDEADPAAARAGAAPDGAERLAGGVLGLPLCLPTDRRWPTDLRPEAGSVAPFIVLFGWPRAKLQVASVGLCGACVEPARRQ